MTKDFFIKQLDNVINAFEGIKMNSHEYDLSDLRIEDIMNIISKSKAAVVRITGDKSEYYKDIASVLNRKDIYEGYKLRLIYGTVQALKHDLENDFLKSLSQIIQSEVFADYLEMAEHLLTEGYKDAAAVLVGSTLEAHLKELSKTNQIDLETRNSKGDLIPKKADTLNSDLAKGDIYNGFHQKQVTAWLAIRNFAAHGHYDKYREEEIKLMLMGVRQFIVMTKAGQ